MDLYRLPSLKEISQYGYVVEYIHEDIEDYVQHPLKIDIILDSSFILHAAKKIPKTSRTGIFWIKQEHQAIYVAIYGGHLEEIIDMQLLDQEAALNYILSLYAVMNTRGLIVNSPIDTPLEFNGEEIDSVSFSDRQRSKIVVGAKV